MRGVGVNLAGRILGQGLQFFCQVLLARFLGPTAFGRYSLGWILLRLGGGMVAPLGLADAVLRFAPRVRNREGREFVGLLRLAVSIALLTGTVLGGLIYFLAPEVADRLYGDPALAPVLMTFAPGFALLSATQVVSAATRITQRMQYSITIEEVAQPLAHCALVGAVFALGGGAVAAAGATSISIALALVLGIVFLERLFPSTFRRGERQSEEAIGPTELLTFSVPTMLGALAFSGLVSVDQLMVGWYQPLGEVSGYRCASIAALMLTVILSAFNIMVSSQIAELHHSGETGRMAALFRMSARWGLYAGVPPFLILCFAPREVLSIFGADYEGASRALMILASAHLFHVVAGPAAPALILTGHARRWTVLTVVALAATVALNMVWIPTYGAAGAAAARALGLCGLVFTTLLMVRSSLGFWAWDLRFVKGLTAGALAAGVLALVRGRFEVHPAIWLAVVATLGTGVFAVGVTAFGLDEDDRRLLGSMRARLAGGR